MKDFLTGVGLATAGLAVFSGSVVGILALQGRLDGAGLGTDSESSSSEPRSDVNAAEASFQTKEEEQAALEKKVQRAREERAASGEFSAEGGGGGGKLFELPFEPQMSVEEINRIANSVGTKQSDVDNERAALRQRRYEQQLREEDLRVRAKSVEKLMEDVKKAQAKLEGRILQFEEEITKLKAAEKRNIKKQAENLQAQDPQVAADTLLKYVPEREDLAVKLLVSMESESAAKVLEQMDRAQAAHLIERATRVIETQGGQ